jgi:hypothetical protein
VLLRISEPLPLIVGNVSVPFRRKPIQGEEQPRGEGVSCNAMALSCPTTAKEHTLSLQCCPFLKRKLPDAHSCGALCAEFPRCLQSLPTTVATDFAELQEHLTQNNESLVARLTFLEQLHDAITHGLERKGDDAASSEHPG